MNVTSELNVAVLRCAAASLRRGDLATLRDLGFGVAEIDAVRGLTLDQMDRLAERAEGHVLQVRLNRQAFWDLIDELRAERSDEEAQMALLRRDAPQEMMEVLYGMGPKRYTRLRRNLDMPPAVGRPAEPTEAEARRVWQAWEALGADTDMSAVEWLRLCDRAGVSCRVAWRLVARWAAPPQAPRARAATTSNDGIREAAP